MGFYPNEDNLVALLSSLAASFLCMLGLFPDLLLELDSINK